MEARLAPHNFIGVFDSGVGGMSVLKHLVAQMPHEEFHYFGDSACSGGSSGDTVDLQNQRYE